MVKLIQQLKEASEKQEFMARLLRTKEPETSFAFFQTAELQRKAAEELIKQIPLKMEIEGGGLTWWYVCPECHGAIDDGDKDCRHCGQAVER